MSRWDESFEERRDRRDQERRKWDADAHYEAWRRGLGDLDYDRMANARWDGQSPEEFASGEQRRILEAKERREMREMEEMQQCEQQEEPPTEPEPNPL